MSEFENKILSVAFNKLIKIAGEYDGWCFGKYIREVLVPNNKSNQKKQYDGNLKFWFKSQEKLDAFMEKMKGNLVKDSNNTYFLTLLGNKIAKIKIFMANDLPKMYSLAHSLIYNGKQWKAFGWILNNEGYLITGLQFGDPEKVKTQILEKKMVLLDSFIYQIFYGSEKLRRLVLIEKYQKFGWKVLVPNGQVITDPTNLNELSNIWNGHSVKV